MENFLRETVFLHVLSGVVWIGAMLTIRFVVHKNIQSIESVELRLSKTLAITKALFHFVLPFIVILLITAIVMVSGNSNFIVYIKEGIWIIMTINFAIMYYRRYMAQKAFDREDFKEALLYLKPISNIILPINIILGLMALYFGVILRGV